MSSFFKRAGDVVLILGLAWGSLVAIAWGYDFVAERSVDGGELERAFEISPVKRALRPAPLRHEDVPNGDAGQGSQTDEHATIVEAGALTVAMCDWFVHLGCSTDLCEERQLEGLATAIVEVVQEADEDGAWVPLGREKAPAFLAAWSYHEVSWKWQRPPRGRSHGERGAFQFHGRVALGFVESGFERNPYKAARGAVAYMNFLRSQCGEHGWPGAYISGECGGVPREVGERFNTARWIFDRMNEVDAIQ